MNVTKIQDAATARAQGAAQTLLRQQARFSEAFAKGEMVSPGLMGDLQEAQEMVMAWTRVERVVRGGDAQRIAEYVEDLQDRLCDGILGGSTSLIANHKEASERKALQNVYGALRRLV
jgi:hypothetical protein